MTGEQNYNFTTALAQWQTDQGVWHYFSVAPDVGEALDGTALMHRLETGQRSGFGSVKLTARIGSTEWRTSAFPFKDAGWSILVSAKVRKAERLVAGDSFAVTLRF